MFSATRWPTTIVEIFDPAFLAGIDRLLAGTILFESIRLRNPLLNAWRVSEATPPFLIMKRKNRGD
jgi:hypothetical protein